MSATPEFGPVFSLCQANPGDLVQVTHVDASKPLKKRLVSMGVSIDSRLQIIQRRGGSLVVGFDSSRIAIGASMSQHILVQAV